MARLASKSSAGTSAACTSAVSLVDRRTGQTHRVNGSPLVVFTSEPERAATELLEGRDAAIWIARIERFDEARA